MSDKTGKKIKAVVSKAVDSKAVGWMVNTATGEQLELLVWASINLCPA